MNAGGTTNTPLVLLERGVYYLGDETRLVTQNLMLEVQDVGHQSNS